MRRLLVFSIIATLLAPVIAKGFKENCYELEIGQAQLLFSRCARATWTKAQKNGHTPRFVSTVLELGKCYGNDDGKLKRMDFGNSHRSCGRCLLEVRDDAIWWNCICPNKAGKWLLSRVDLNQHLRNDDGYVCCGGLDQCSRDIREDPYEPSNKRRRGIEGLLGGAWNETIVRDADPAADAEWDEAVAGLWDASWDGSS